MSMGGDGRPLSGRLYVYLWWDRQSGRNSLHGVISGTVRSNIIGPGPLLSLDGTVGVTTETGYRFGSLIHDQAPEPADERVHLIQASRQSPSKRYAGRLGGW